MATQQAASMLAGQVLEKRYTLERKLGGGEDETREITTWRSLDAVLARPVVVRVVRGPRAGAKLVEAAAATGSIRQAALAPLLDTVRDNARNVHGVVREWVDGDQLLEVLTTKGLRRDESVTLIIAIAEGLAALHRAGVPHGHLAPANVFIRADGRVVVTDPGMRSSQVTRVAALKDAMAADLMALSDLIHLVLSGTWPGDPDDAPGVPPTARDVNGPLSPRQVRAGVPRDHDALWGRAAHSVNVVAAAPFTSIEELIEAARALPAAPLGAPPEEPLTPPRVDLRWSQTIWAKRARKSTPWLVLVSIAVIGWVLGLKIGALPGQNHTGATTGAGSESGQASEVKPIRFVSFDPPPGDGTEDPDAVPLAHDGDTSTSWQTDTYQGSPKLGGLKQGVGLAIDLGDAYPIKTVNLSLPFASQTIELLAADSPGTQFTDYSVVATATNTSTQISLHPSSGDHRYWVIWITSLAKVSDGYRGGISEFAFLR